MPASDTFRDIHRLLADFYAALDTGTSAEAAALFAADGTWLRLGTELEGPKAVQGALDQRPADRISAHFFANLRVLDETESRCSFDYGLTVHAARTQGGETVAGTQTMVVMRGRDTAVREDGAWRFASKASRILFRAETG